MASSYDPVNRFRLFWSSNPPQHPLVHSPCIVVRFNRQCLQSKIYLQPREWHIKVFFWWVPSALPQKSSHVCNQRMIRLLSTVVYREVSEFKPGSFIVWSGDSFQVLTLQTRNLSYTYPGSKEPCLKDISFKLEAGETLAIVGYNGSGVSFYFSFAMLC